MTYPFSGYDSYYDPPGEKECPECDRAVDLSCEECPDCGYVWYDPRDDEPHDFDEWRDGV